MKKIIRYMCDICCQEYDSEELAIKCENDILPESIFNIGDKILFINSDREELGYVQSVITNIIIKYRFGQHNRIFTVEGDLQDYDRTDYKFIKLEDVEWVQGKIDIDDKNVLIKYVDDFDNLVINTTYTSLAEELISNKNFMWSKLPNYTKQ